MCSTPSVRVLADGKEWDRTDIPRYVIIGNGLLEVRYELMYFGRVFNVQE